LARYEVLLEKRAEKELKALPPDVVQRFRRVFEMLEENPYRPKPGWDIRVMAASIEGNGIRVLGTSFSMRRALALQP